MKMVVAIISTEDANKIQKVLIESGIIATRLATTSGFLRARNATFLIGVNDEQVPDVLNLIEENTKKRNVTVPNTIVNEFGAFASLPIEVEVGGATIFVLNVDQFMKVWFDCFL